jgi:phosphonoacetaldehyde hydrolase
MMMYRCFLDLDVDPAAAVVKVDDTAPGIAEGIAAGCWTVGITLTGNECGLSLEELAARTPAEVAALRDAAAWRLRAAGAHYLLDSAAGLLPVLADITARMARGERP